MTRMMLMTFFGERAAGRTDVAPARVARPVMTVPMIVLAVGSVVGGRLPDHRRRLRALAGAGRSARRRSDARDLAAGLR